MRRAILLLAGLLLVGACDDMTDQPKQKAYSPRAGPAAGARPARWNTWTSRCRRRR